MRKLTVLETILFAIGYKYIANKTTKEIHDLYHVHHNCNIHLISKSNKKFLTESKKNYFIQNDGYNGCRWCMPKENTDKI